MSFSGKICSRYKAFFQKKAVTYNHQFPAEKVQFTDAAGNIHRKIHHSKNS